MRSALSLALLLAVPAAAQQVAPVEPTPYQRAIAAGYKAAMLCSGIFNADRSQAQVEAVELRGIYSEYDAIMPTLAAKVDEGWQSVSVPFDDHLPPRAALWRVGRGCVTYPIGATPPITLRQATDPGDPQPDPRRWPVGDAGVAPRPSATVAGIVARAFDGKSYGAGPITTGVVVLRRGQVVAERYADGFGPFVSNRTWSAGKSLAGALVGTAVHDCALDVAAPAPIPEWRSSEVGDVADPRAAITTDQLLRMASGLHSDSAGNRTDAIYFDGTAITEQATGWPLEASPGTRFRYANNDILLAVRGLRARLGDARYERASRVLFRRLGMFHTVAETDWRGNYILSSQVWSTARDLARFGQFMLQDGVWQGERLLPAGWMADSVKPLGPQPATGPGYGRTLWLFGARQGLPASSYAAQGNRGQYIMVIPFERLVIVRRGEDPGPARFDIARFAADVIAAR